MKNFFLIAGPCVVESIDLCDEIAGKVKELTTKYDIPYYFKASYRKANRSRLDSFKGEGDIAGLEIIAHIGKTHNLPTLTDIHESHEAAIAASFVDVLQIPAFLCRQTDLLIAAAKTGKIVNIKKGQFLSPDAMQHAVNKVKANSEAPVWLTERGTTFGYQDMVVDFRGIPIMKETGCPVILDCTHSLQQPNQTSGVTGGLPHLIETIGKCGIAAGCDGIFIETHPNPAKALSDGANMLALDKLDALLEKLVRVREAVS
ncbi:MAG: 3-deoxy-8-phosphooctulonate synthase [Bacteroidota bacterium]|nr:3-deoxy-8-phosphooctulonate synthase [Bacteroidota bacterium]